MSGRLSYCYEQYILKKDLAEKQFFKGSFYFFLLCFDIFRIGIKNYILGNVFNQYPTRSNFLTTEKIKRASSMNSCWVSFLISASRVLNDLMFILSGNHPF